MSSVLVAIRDDGYDGTEILFVTSDLELAEMRGAAELLHDEDRPRVLANVEGWSYEPPTTPTLVPGSGYDSNLHLYWTERSVAAMALDSNSGVRIERWEIE